jgi:hypothetical protein
MIEGLTLQPQGIAQFAYASGVLHDAWHRVYSATAMELLGGCRLMADEVVKGSAGSVASLALNGHSPMCARSRVFPGVRRKAWQVDVHPPRLVLNGSGYRPRGRQEVAAEVAVRLAAGAGVSVNVAVTVWVPSRDAIVHGAVPVQPPPAHPVKVEDALAVAVSVMLVPSGYGSVQSVPQLMPATLEVTVPPPVPASTTVTVS